MKLLDFADLLKETWFFIAVIVGIFLVFVVYYLLSKYFFGRRKNRRQINDLEKKYEYYHALLIGQSAQHVKRLEIISQTNLLYVEVHEQFLERFQSILGTNDQQAQLAIENVKKFISENKYQNSKEIYNKSKNIIGVYERLVNDLNRDLGKVIKPEEECRQASLKQKEMMRAIKNKYFVIQNDIKNVEASFNSIFEVIDEKFSEYERFIESAEYEEANKILPLIGKMLSELEDALEVLPNLCTLIDHALPESIMRLQDAYNTLKISDTPLHHLKVNFAIEQMNVELYDLQMKVANFELRSIKERAQAILDSIEEFYHFFESEKVAKKQFNDDVDNVYQEYNSIEKRFIKLCNKIPEVKKIYQLEERYVDGINELQNEINHLSNLKRALDNYIHSSSKQPYTILVTKMNDLKTATMVIIKKMDDFANYISSLKVDSENAYKLLNSLFLGLKEGERKVRDLMIPNYSKKVDPFFEQSFEYLDRIHELLNSTPIDVKEINENVKRVVLLTDSLFSEIESNAKLCLLAESAVVHANVTRSEFVEIKKSLIKYEHSFFEGDFERTYIETGNILKKVHANSSSNNK